MCQVLYHGKAIAISTLDTLTDKVKRVV